MDKTIVQLQEGGEELQSQERPSWQKGGPDRREERKVWGERGAVGTAQGQACSNGAAPLLLAGMPATCPD